MSRAQRLKAAIEYELVFRGVTPSVSYLGIIILLGYHRFWVDRYEGAVLLGATAVAVFSTARAVLSAWVKKKGKCTSQEAFIYQVLTLLISVSWSVCFTLSSIELGYQHFSSTFRLSIIAGFVSASVPTVGISPRLLIANSLILLIPQVAIALSEYLSGDPSGSWIALGCAILAFFAIFQGFDIRRRTLRRLENEFELEEAHTELVRNTAKTQHTARLATVGILASGVAHEINNPLSIISASLVLAKSGILKGTASPEQIIDRIDKSSRAVDRALAIVQSLRRFARQEDDQEKEPASLFGIIRETLDFCNERFRSHGVEIIVPPESQLDYTLHCRPVQVSQILVNLLNNAYDAMMEEHVDPAVITLSVKERDGQVTICVANTGASIPTAVRDKLFAPFFTTKQVGQGTGLGLSISRELAIEHQGDLFLDVSAKDTTFCLRLPLCRASSSDRSAA